MTLSAIWDKSSCINLWKANQIAQPHRACPTCSLRKLHIASSWGVFLGWVEITSWWLACSGSSYGWPLSQKIQGCWVNQQAQ